MNTQSKANWLHSLDIGEKFNVSISEKGAIKLSTQRGKYMFCMQITDIAELVPVLQAFIETEEYKAALDLKHKASYQKQKDTAITKEMLKLQATIEALQRAGVNVSEVLKGK